MPHETRYLRKTQGAGAYAKLLNGSVTLHPNASAGVRRKEGYFEIGGGYIVSWCYGHLVEPESADAYGEQYRRWNRDVLPILPGA